MLYRAADVFKWDIQKLGCKISRNEKEQEKKNTT